MAVAAVLGACASGQQLAPGDGQGGAPDSPPGRGPDAAVVNDAAVVHDAKLPPDAHVYLDAHEYLDAHIYMDAPAVQDAPPCTPHTTELLGNPALDLTPMGSGWTQAPIDPAYPDITSDGLAPQSTPYKMWMGGFAGTDKGVSSVTDVVYQDIAVPANTTQLVLTYYYVVGTTENPNDYPYDTGSVDLIQTNGTPIENAQALSNQTSAGTWTAYSHTFTANVSGQTVRLRFTSTNDVTNLTNFFFDTISLNATHCP